MKLAAVSSSLLLGLLVASEASAGTCDDPEPEWLACEDFEGGARGWSAWFTDSPFIDCLGCSDGNAENPDRIMLTDAEAHEGSWSLYMPAAAAAQYQGASLAYRSCAGDQHPGCTLNGYDRLYFRAWVKLAEDHQYVHHFLSLAGTRPDGYWDADGNAGCRPNGYRAAGTTLDFNEDHELFFYTYYPEMNCDAGGYCSGEYAQGICDGCATKDMACENGLECCWGNHFSGDTVVLPRGEWVCLEIMMQLNTPGQADGRMAYWIDDELGHEQTGMHWRDVPELQLNKAWLQHYIDVGDADQSNRIWFDDVVVSTERIGCLQSIPGDTDGTSGGETGGDDDSGTTADTQGTGSGPGSGYDGTSGPDGDGTGGSDGSSSGDANGDDGGGCGCRSGSGASALALLPLFALVRRRRTLASIALTRPAAGGCPATAPSRSRPNRPRATVPGSSGGARLHR